MKSTRLFLGLFLIAFVFSLSVLPVFADATNSIIGTNAVTGAKANEVATAVSGKALLMSIMPLMIPLIIAACKWAEGIFMPRIPVWVLPILAPALGALIDWIASLATGNAANPIIAGLLGLAGTGVREVYDQAKTRIQNGPAPQFPNPPAE